jgi:hypothetical protein
VAAKICTFWSMPSIHDEVRFDFLDLQRVEPRKFEIRSEVAAHVGVDDRPGQGERVAAMLFPEPG